MYITPPKIARISSFCMVMRRSLALKGAQESISSGATDPTLCLRPWLEPLRATYARQALICSGKNRPAGAHQRGRPRPIQPLRGSHPAARRFLDKTRTRCGRCAQTIRRSVVVVLCSRASCALPRPPRPPLAHSAPFDDRRATLPCSRVVCAVQCLWMS